MYVPPQQSRFFNEDEFELFEHEFSSACSKDYHVLLTGDFNAQTSDMEILHQLTLFYLNISSLRRTLLNFLIKNVSWKNITCKLIECQKTTK